MRGYLKKGFVIFMAGALLAGGTSCKSKGNDMVNLAENAEEDKKVVNLFGPMEKSNPDADNIARSAHDLTVMMAEEELGLTVEYRTYTAENYQDKTYDDVTLARARSDMDDMYLLNPDTIQILGGEGKLVDLSCLESAANLREVVKVSNTVDGKLVAIPQEVVVYGLFVNQDMFDQYELELPNTPEEFLECCRVFKENGVETPVGANRWWLENFVFALAYADLYNGGNTEAEIAALNSGEAKYSDYMREGFEFVKTLIDLGYVDAEKAFTYEAIEGEGPDFMAQKTPIVMAYWGAANAETAYGKPDFNLKVIGFPTHRGQMPVASMSGYGVCVNAEHLEDTLAVLDIMLSDEALQVYTETNRVISPSKNVEVDCIDALKPVNELVNEGIFVLGSNAGMKLEQWGNTCLVVREMLDGASVEECLEEMDRLQGETIQN
ncbi:extracellular solute-binding protein [Candidatus Merdisoma sp. JLR.KK006]|uniref:ABC transporter substrate-binding protein n=1 Tax=Candidatus Merdisoma sp. JLR.KK006 TaxID=3112626 RepID=UPI002FF17214